MSDTGERVREYYREQGRQEQIERLEALLPYILSLGSTIKEIQDEETTRYLLSLALRAVRERSITIEVIKEGLE